MAVNIDYKEYLQFLPAVEHSPSAELNVLYDKGADVLYVNFDASAEAADSELLENGVIARYDDKNRMIGITLMHARKSYTSLDVLAKIGSAK